MLLSFHLQLNVIRHVSSSTKSPLLDPTTASPSMIPSIHHSSESTTVPQTPTQTGEPGISAHSTTQSPQTLTPSERGLTEEISVSLLQPTRAPAVSHSTQQTTTAGMSRWVLQLNGYVILRDLERYLSRLARDYTVLQTKYWQNKKQKQNRKIPGGKKSKPSIKLAQVLNFKRKCVILYTNIHMHNFMQLFTFLMNYINENNVLLFVYKLLNSLS